ncbi:Tomoregulin-2 [Collichthys lucidus]|uniref:Tomoregulin-2 n=1 Tax=Collichthys lucidus TaxID=240159 RepID=A0A4U5U0M5_COLLU|nr:Tomoregulin-2 [Collichthys lucidus]
MNTLAFCSCHAHTHTHTFRTVDTSAVAVFSVEMPRDCPGFVTAECNNDYAPVCGSNNQNYQNECFLRRDACKQQSEVLIMSEGACPADAGSGSGDDAVFYQMSSRLLSFSGRIKQRRHKHPKSVMLLHIYTENRSKKEARKLGYLCIHLKSRSDEDRRATSSPEKAEMKSSTPRLCIEILIGVFHLMGVWAHPEKHSLNSPHTQMTSDVDELEPTSPFTANNHSEQSSNNSHFRILVSKWHYISPE